MPEAGGVRAMRAAMATRRMLPPARAQRAAAAAARAGTRRGWAHAAARDSEPRAQAPAGRASLLRSGRIRTRLWARRTCAPATRALRTGLHREHLRTCVEWALRDSTTRIIKCTSATTYPFRVRTLDRWIRDRSAWCGCLSRVPQCDCMSEWALGWNSSPAHRGTHPPLYTSNSYVHVKRSANICKYCISVTLKVCIVCCFNTL